MAYTTRAAVLRTVGEPLEIETLSVDTPDADEVLVRMVAAGVCHSDYHFMTGLNHSRMPVVLGHEGAGIVEAVGDGVSRVKVGDRVVQSFVAPCGHCAECLRRMYTNCVTAVDGSGPNGRDGSMLDGTFRLHGSDGPVGSGFRLGAFSELSICHERALIPLRDDVPMDVAALMACGVATGIGAAVNVGTVRPGAHVGVFGIGGVGAATICGAEIAGAAKLIAFDVNADKRQFALDLGATDYVDAASEALEEEVRSLTQGRGLDRVFLCMSTVRPSHVATAMKVAGVNGEVVVVGVPEKGFEAIPVNPQTMMRSHKSISATMYGGMDPHRDIFMLMDLYAAGRLPLDRFVTRRYELSEINDAFNDMQNGRNVRGLIEF